MSKRPKSKSNSETLCTILVVEDNADHAELIRRHVEKVPDSRLSLDFATSLREGLKALSEKSFNLVLLDLSLPDSLIENTVSSVADANPEIPIVVLTSLDDIALGERAILEGAQDYLVKSELSGTLLVRSITYAIEQKKQALALEQSNRDLQQFASTIAHEIKNPLAVIISCLSLVEKRHGEHFSENTVKLIGNTRARAAVLSDLISELLRFARLNPELDAQEVSVSEIVGRVVKDYGPLIRRQGAIIKVEPLPDIICDSGLMHQVFDNLIGNALKYSPEKAEIDVGFEIDGDEWKFYIRDNGIGIDEESKDKVFDIFARAKNVGEIPGTGIGLAFSRRIIEHHNGKLWCESRAASGSTFYFTIPKQPDKNKLGC